MADFKTFLCDGIKYKQLNINKMKTEEVVKKINI